MRYPAPPRLPLLLALAAALSASPALAQGKGRGDESKRERPELVRRETDKARKELEARRKAAERERKAREEAVKAQPEARSERLRTRDGYWPAGDRRDDDRWDDRRGWAGGQGVPPGWCQGRGNPHATPENCGYERGGWGYGSDDGWGSGSRAAGDRRYDSYDRAHAEFHRVHDRQCQLRAAERPLDIQWQLQVRGECRQRHDDWHHRAGRRHS